MTYIEKRDLKIENYIRKSSKEISEGIIERLEDYLDDSQSDSPEDIKLSVILLKISDLSKFTSVSEFESFVTYACGDLDLSEVFYDSVNGADLPMTFEDICDEVQCNPRCSSQESADEKYYFSADESLSYSPQEIADLINITLEIFNEEN